MCAPWLRVDAMVVSEIMDKLSPKMAPDTKQPATSAASKFAVSIKPSATGAIAAMVPIEVPMAVDKKAATRNSPGNNR